VTARNCRKVVMPSQHAGATQLRQLEPAPASACVPWDFVEHYPGGVAARADRVELAVHEAGHAVVGYLAGFPVPHDDWVVIADTPGDAAFASIGRTPLHEPAIGADCSGYLVALLAGNVAVECLMPGLIRVATDDALKQIIRGKDTNWCDDQRALFLIKGGLPHANENDIVAAYRRLELAARSTIEVFFVLAAIESVMAVLIEKQRISGRDVARTIELAKQLPIPAQIEAFHA
jgi:hypothetical protein